MIVTDFVAHFHARAVEGRQIEASADHGGQKGVTETSRGEGCGIYYAADKLRDLFAVLPAVGSTEFSPAVRAAVAVTLSNAINLTMATKPTRTAARARQRMEVAIYAEALAMLADVRVAP